MLAAPLTTKVTSGLTERIGAYKSEHVGRG
jgi:hypothetical protein